MLPALSGCLQLFGDDEVAPEPLSETGFAVPGGISPDQPLAASAITWPDFAGQKLRILDHGAFAAFESAAARFEELTNATVEHFEAADTGSALNLALRDRDDPQYDILYGIDNALLAKALVDADGDATDDPDDWLFAPYTPQLAARVPDERVFFGDDFEIWPATPVDHGYVAVNVDHNDTRLENITVENLFDVRGQAKLFVTQDPRFSTPGLGFLLLTIDRFGEDDLYDWQDYWRDLFEGGVLVTPDWGEAYEAHFTGGYGQALPGHIGSHPIVTSYTNSPAYEWYYDEVYPSQSGDYEPGGLYDGNPDNLPDVVLDPRGPTAFHQTQTMGVLAGTERLALAQAWIEFTLTDDFQDLAALENAVYPIVPVVDTGPVYGDLDPEPGSFQTTTLTWETIGENLDRWIDEWVDLCEASDCA